MRKKYSSNYGKFAYLNKIFRDSPIAPSAFSKVKGRGIVGKGISMVGDKIIEGPLHKITYGVVGTLYVNKEHSPYLGSALYTIFKWILLLILARYSNLLFILIIIGLLGKLKKICK